MTHLSPIDVDDDVYRAFKIVLATLDLTVKEGLEQAVLEFAQNHNVDQVKIEVVIQERREKEDLMQFVIEGEINDKLNEILRAQERKASSRYIQQTKLDTLDLLKRAQRLPRPLAQKVKAVFKNLHADVSQ